MSRGSPTFTETSRATSLRVGGRLSWPCARERFGDGEVAIRAVWNYRLTGLEVDLQTIDLHGDDIRLERHEARDAADLGIRLTIRPCRLTCVTDVGVAAQPFVRAEGRVVQSRPRRLVDGT